MGASATAEVPFGFICGFPTRSGDLYGGNLYGRSAAAAATAAPSPKSAASSSSSSNTPSCSYSLGAGGLQARAQAEAARRWGSGPPGREQIAHPVCKGKYQPWKGGERQFGCFRHHNIRKQRIERAGLRLGWVSFEQWPAPK